MRFYTFDQLEGLIDGLREEAEIERPQILIQPEPAPAGEGADMPEDGDSGDEPG